MNKRVWFGLLSGNMIEYYDYVLYGLMAPVLSRLFFPSDDQFASLAATFVVFATTMMIRPIGGFLFGLLGNRIGRKTVLMLSSMITGLGTLLIGFLPSVESIGTTATVLLVVLRLLQGLGMSSEFCSVLVIGGEVAPPKNRGFLSSLAHSSGMAGTLLGSLMVMAVYSLPEAEIYSWGWRVPFWFGGVICLNALILRSRLPEILSQPIKLEKGIIAAHKIVFLRMLMIIAINTVVYYLLFVFQSTRMIEMLAIPSGQAMLINSLSLLLLVFFCGFSGYLADRVGHRVTYLSSLVILTVCGIPLMILMSQGNILYCALGQFLSAVIGGFILGSSSALYTEIWPHSLRMMGTNIPYSLAIVCFGGTTPLIALYLVKFTDLPWATGIYLSLLCLISIPLLWGIRDRTGEVLDGGTTLASSSISWK